MYHIYVMILDFIANLFKSKKDNNMDTKTNATTQQPPKKRKHKLEIQVYEADWEKADANNGHPMWRPVRSDPILDGGRPNIIEVADKVEFAEIQKQYAMCDQRIKVIREIDPFVDEPEKPTTASTIPQDNRAIPIETSSAESSPNVVFPSSSSTNSSTIQQAMPMPNVANIAEKLVNAQMPVSKAKAKIVTIGDIEVKYDGDKVYQKQWMKLTPVEAANFRIVTDLNNKIVSMNGKHIEAKRWTLVEDHSEESMNDAVESILNG